MEFKEVVKARRTVRLFNAKQIDEQILGDIIKDAQRSPSWANTQATRAYIVMGETLKKIKADHAANKGSGKSDIPTLHRQAWGERALANQGALMGSWKEYLGDMTQFGLSQGKLYDAAALACFTVPKDAPQWALHSVTQPTIRSTTSSRRAFPSRTSALSKNNFRFQSTASAAGVTCRFCLRQKSFFATITAAYLALADCRSKSLCKAGVRLNFFEVHRLKRGRFLAVMLSTYMLIQLSLRAAIVATSSELLDQPSIPQTLALGAVFDLVVGLAFMIPISILALPSNNTLLRRRILLTAVFVFDFVTLLVAAAQFLFWQEFHTNFNFIAVDYLIYTQELLGNIVQSFNVPLLLIVITLVTVAVFNVQSRLLPRFRALELRRILSSIVAIVLIPSVGLLIVQSDWRERLGSNRHNVELAGNGAYEFVRAYFGNELDYPTFYVTHDERQVIRRLRAELETDNAIFVNDVDITRRVENVNELTGIKPNVIMITVESLNAEFMGAFGGELTPRLDEIARRSFCFGRMYATGTRTVRGLEALSLSLPPTPGQSILRRADNADMSTLGAIFRAEGYACDFLYGGYGYFDNMNAFFGGNGYVVKDRTTIPDAEIFHETIWGVADEILFSQVLRSMDEHYDRGERAFEMVMTTSNHRPFKFPGGRVDAEEGTRQAAVMYTDWAIGDFLERASTRAWFDETVFVIVADHQALAAGKASLPVNCYHIPCMIYAPKLVAAGRSELLISQMDLPPTLLGMLGVTYESKFLGRDVLREGSGAAFISTYQMLGMIEGDVLVVLTPDKKVAAYRIDDWERSEYTLIDPPSELIEDVVAYYQGASYLYKNGLLKRSSGR